MKTEVERRGRVLESYTLCDADCEPEYGIHNPRTERCDRCGALLHKRIFKVETAAGEELTVGSECMRDVCGYRLGKSHEQLLEYLPKIRELVKQGYTHMLRESVVGEKQFYIVKGKYDRWGKVWAKKKEAFVIPLRPIYRILRAGVDLGLWENEERGAFLDGSLARCRELTLKQEKGAAV